MTITKILFIGDPHFKVNNNEITDVFIEKSLEILSSINDDDNISKDNFCCVIGGDVLDTHERLHQTPFNKALDFIKAIRDICPVIILVGNHDYENNQQFLTKKHWMNPLKEWKNVFIADKVINIDDFIFVPYVPPGRFLEALDTFTEKDWRDSKCIFAHQEFKGCQYRGDLVSENGDKWPEHYPLIISGHIHKPHKPQKNIIYPGSVVQHNFGEQDNKTGLLFIDFDETEEKKRFKVIPLNIPTMTTLDIECEAFEKTIKNLILKPLQKIRIICSGTEEQIKKIKKTNLYQNLPVGAYVSFKNSELACRLKELNNDDDNDLNFESFDSVFKKILDEKSTELNKLFEDVIAGKSFEEVLLNFSINN